MDRGEAIQLLKELIEQIPYLRTLNYDNNEYIPWRDRVGNVIKVALDEDDYQKFLRTGKRADMIIMGNVVHQDNYTKNLKDCQTTLQLILDKYQILGVEKKPASKAASPKDTSQSPIDLFDRMQFHPKIVEASESLFKDGHYSSAILEAFKAVENFVKRKSGLSISGKALMSRVFREEDSIIKLNELATQSDKDEQEGFMFLFMGATVGIRNPKAHDIVIQKDPFKTLEYLAFASLLIKKIDFWDVDKSQH